MKHKFKTKILSYLFKIKYPMQLQIENYQLIQLQRVQTQKLANPSNILFLKQLIQIVSLIAFSSFFRTHKFLIKSKQIILFKQALHLNFIFFLKEKKIKILFAFIIHSPSFFIIF